ncbi:MAG: MMPL family transporter [Actinomycetales bacterium]|nr:MMPL family transporter [Actinomycetales bacterium]
MLAGWGRVVVRWRWVVLVTGAVAVTVAAVWGASVFSTLIPGGFEDPNAESTRIEARVEATVGRQATDLVVLYSSPDRTVDDPGYRDAVTRALDALPPEAVTRVTTYWNSGGSPALVSTDRRDTIAAVQLAGRNHGDRVTAYEEIEPMLRSVGAGLQVRLGGEAATNGQISEQVSADLGRAEGLSLPILLVLLVIIFGSAVAAGVPLLVGVATMLGSFAILRGLAEITDVSVFAVNIVTLLGLGLSIDYALFVVSRFREERRARLDLGDALAATMATAGRTVVVSGVTVAGSLAGLLLFPQVFLRSMAFGGIAAVLVALVSALTLLPAVLAVLDHRLDALRLPRFRRRSAGGGRDGWARFARVVMRRPVVFAGTAVALLLTLGAPFLRAEFGGIDTRALPEGAEARVVDEIMREQFRGTDAYPISVLVEGGPDAATALVAAVEELDGVTAVTPQASTPTATLLAVDHAGGALDAETLDLVTAIRDLPEPTGVEVLVGGASAYQVDVRASIADRLPLMIGVMAVATFLLLFLAFGSVVLPLTAILANVVSIGASFGVVVWIFQDGHLADLLGFTPTGTIETTQPILMLAIIFGLSMDYEVFLLSRIAEHWRSTGDATAAVAAGLQRTGRIITSAALLLVVVIGAFSTSGITFIKMIGVGMAVAIVVDATVVRAVLVPAVLRLLGPAAWWAPAPLQRWQRRLGWSDEGAVPTPDGDDPSPARTEDLVGVS